MREHPPRTWLLVLAALGLALFLMVTRDGIGISPDSTKLLEASRNLAEGRGFVLTGAGTPEPLTQWPPLFPLAVAGAQALGLAPAEGARAVNGLLFFGIILLIGAMVWTATRSRFCTLAAAGAILFGVEIPSIHSSAWSEPMFVLTGMTSLHLLALYLNSSRRILLIGAAILAAVSFLSRYPGMAFAFAGAWTLARAATADRIRAAAAFLVMGVGPGFLWMVRNQITGGSMSGNTMGFHPGALPKRAIEFAATLARWAVPIPIPTVARLGMIALAAGVLIVYFRRRRSIPAERESLEPTPYAAGMVRLATAFAGIYMSLLLFSQIFVDGGTPFDTRILAPLYPLLVVVGSIRFHAALRSVELLPQFKRILRATVGATAILFVAATVMWVRSGYAMGMGYSSPAWTQSETLAAAKEIPKSTTIYSNAPDVIRFLLDRPALKLPVKLDPRTRRENPELTAQMQQIVGELAADDGAVVYFSNSPRNYLVTEADLREKWGLDIARELKDGSILKVNSAKRTGKSE